MTDATTAEPCVKLEWDTAFFGFPVARVLTDRLDAPLVSRIDAWCSRETIRCLYFLARGDDAETVELAERNGFRLVDVRIRFERDLLDTDNATDPSIRPAAAADHAALRRIARNAHRDARFYFDRNFSPDACDALYERWITASCEGFADAVFIAESATGPLGYVTCNARRGEGLGQIGLLGVDTESRGAGVGQSLVRAALAWFAPQGLATASVVTQARNLGAQRLYHRCGFLPRQVGLYFHKWYCGA